MWTVAFCLAVCSQLRAADAASAAENELLADQQVTSVPVAQKKAILQFVPEVSSINLEGLGSRLSFGAGIFLSYPIRERLILAGGIREGFSRKEEFASLYTAFDLRFLYSVFENPYPIQAEYFRGEKSFLRTSSSYTGGLFLEASIKQYFFNYRRGAEPFSGFGVGLLYDFFSVGPYSFGVGGGVDRLSNGNVSILLYRGQLHFGMFI